MCLTPRLYPLINAVISFLFSLRAVSCCGRCGCCPWPCSCSRICLSLIHICFVSAASHELRTPLQVIRFNAEALKLEPPDPTPFIEQILKELTHMGRLSEDLLLLTAAPGQARKGDPVEASVLIQRAVECHAAAAAQKGVQLHAVRPEGTLPLVEGSEAMLLSLIHI